MSATQFGTTEFALGSVTGFRSWEIKEAGHLKALSYSTIWAPGENQAVCESYGTDKQVPKIEGEEHADRRKRVEAWKSAHDMTECEHGFYAYFTADGMRGHYGSGPVIYGAIEGFGEVLIGTKGFRAMKARILALAIEPHDGIWGLEQHVRDRLARNYPNIPIFDSSLAMQAEVPATRLEEVSL